MVDTVVIKEPISGEPEGHTEKMVAVVDGANPTPAAEDRPSWLPEKFKTAEEMAKAYSELEGKLGKPAEPAAPETPPATPAEPTAEEATKALEAKGLDIMEFSRSYAANGSLTEAEYQKLSEGGYPRDLVDSFIAGQKAKASAYESSLKSAIGGDEEFAAMSEWAGANMTADELATYNRAVASGNAAEAKLAVLGVYQQFRAARPAEPNLVAGANGAVTGDVYESVQQMTADMRNPLYKTDPAFRKKVEAKISRSNVL